MSVTRSPDSSVADKENRSCIRPRSGSHSVWQDVSRFRGKRMKVVDLASCPAVTVSPRTPVWLAAEVMERSGYGFLPISDDGRVVGVITGRDMAVRVAGHMISPDHLTVSAVMTSPAICIAADSDPEDALTVMGQVDVRRLP